jgi:putative ABC transport system permease protein
MTGNILKLAWRNSWRNRRRTFFTLLALSIGVMSVIFARSYIAGIVNNASESMIKTQAGHIRIAHKKYLRLERIMPKEYLVPEADDLKKALLNSPGIDVVSFDERLKFNVLLSHGENNEPAIAIGIRPEQTDKTMELSGAIVKGSYFESGTRGQTLIIGKKLAELLNVTLNDELLLVTTDINYSTYALPFKIVGIFETGYSNIDKHQLFIPLNKAQEMMDCGKSVHELLIFVNNPAAAKETAEKVEQVAAAALAKTGNLKKQDLAVIPWQENDMIANAMPMIEDVYDLILGIVMLIVALVILNTMLMAVMERYHEIGVMKALGFKNREVFGMIVTEAFYIGAIGSIIGGILGGSLSAYFSKAGMNITQMMGQDLMDKIDIPLPFFGKILYPQLTAAILFGSLLFGLVVALLAVLYPAFKSSRMLPVEAFRSELKV